MNSVKHAKVGKKRPFYNFAYDFVRVTGALPGFLWFRFKIHRPYGTKLPKGAVLIVANHNSMMDPIIMNLALFGRRMHSLATSQLFRNKLASTFFNMMHCIKVDKDNFNVSTFRAVSDRLGEGKAVLIFPEGRINPYRKLAHFRPGVFKIAQKANVPIVVCTLQGTNHVIPNLLKLKPSTVDVHLLDVIQPEQVAGKTTVEIAEEIYAMMAADLGPENVLSSAEEENT